MGGKPIWKKSPALVFGGLLIVAFGGTIAIYVASGGQL